MSDIDLPTRLRRSYGRQDCDICNADSVKFIRCGRGECGLLDRDRDNAADEIESLREQVSVLIAHLDNDRSALRLVRAEVERLRAESATICPATTPAPYDCRCQLSSGASCERLYCARRQMDCAGLNGQ